MTLRLAFAALALALVLPLSACDETGDAATSDVAVTISDAQIARTRGDYETSVRLLEAALAANPQSAAVRTELAVTILAREQINLLDLDRIAQFVVNGVGGAAEAPAARGTGTCRFATDPTARPFDPTAVAGFPAITASRAEIDRVIALLEPVLPAALRSFDACTAIGPGGRLVYDRAAATAQLRAAGLSDAQIGQLLATNALARFMRAFLTVTTDLPQQTTWYRLADGSIGVCAADEDRLIGQTRPAVETLGTALLSLDTRARSFGGASDIVDLATDAFADIRDALGEFCAAR